MALFVSNIDSVSGRGTHLFADKTQFLFNSEGVSDIRKNDTWKSSFYYNLNIKDDRAGRVRVESRLRAWKVVAYGNDNITNLFITLTVYKEANSNSDTEDIKYKANDICLAYDVDAGAIVYVRHGVELDRIMVSESISDILYEISNTTTTTTSTTSSSTTSTSTTSTSTTTTTVDLFADAIEIGINGAVSFSMYIQTNDSMLIDWGDGSEYGTVDSGEGYVEKTHVFSGASTIQISNAASVMNLGLGGNEDFEVSSVVIPNTASSLVNLYIYYSPLTELVTHAEWTSLSILDTSGSSITSLELHDEWANFTRILAPGSSLATLTTAAGLVSLTHITIYNTNISSLTTYATWTSLSVVIVYNTNLTSFVTHAEWTEITVFNVNASPITAITIPATWTKLNTLDISSTDISTFTTHAEWVLLNTFYIDNTSISSLATYAAWIKFAQFRINNTSISSLTTHAEWTFLRDLYANDTSLTTLIAHAEWLQITNFRAQNNAITSATDINNILIALDTAGMDSGTVDLSGGTNACPTGAGLTAKTNLDGRGVTVNVNTGCPTTTTTTTTTTA